MLVASTLIGPSSTAGAGAGAPTLLAAGEIASAPSYDHVILLWDERLDERVNPVETDFTVTVNNIDHAPRLATYLLSGLGGPDAPFDPSGTTLLRLDLPQGVTVDTTSSIQIDYHSHGTPLRDLSLTPVADFPVPFQAAVFDPGGSGFFFEVAIVDADHGANKLALAFIGQIDLSSIPLRDRFEVTVNGTVATVDAVVPIFPDVGIGILDLVLHDPVVHGDAVRVTYTRGANPIQGRNGGGAIDTFTADAQMFLPLNQTATTVPSTSLTTSTGAPTAFDPVATTIQSPTPVSATISEVALNPDLPGYSFFGEQVIITTSADATAASPFVFTFKIDAAAIPAGGTKGSVVILRNGTAVGPCTGPLGQAVPTPCVSLRADIGDGDIAVTVLTVAASIWNMAVVVPYTFGGFQRPVDSPPVRNVAQAGSAIPVKFSLGGNRGTAIFTAGSPSSQAVTCDTTSPLDVIEETVSAGASSLSYDPGSDRYTYVWKTSKAWAGTCRRLQLSFGDGSAAVALFQFRP